MKISEAYAILENNKSIFRDNGTPGYFTAMSINALTDKEFQAMSLVNCDIANRYFSNWHCQCDDPDCMWI